MRADYGSTQSLRESGRLSGNERASLPKYRPPSDRLARGGYSLVLAARDAARLQTLSEELKSAGPGTHAWISVDMTKDESVHAFAAELASRNVTLDGAVLMPPQPHRSDDPLPS